MEKDFAAGRLKDVEQKIREYGAMGKSFFDLSKEEPDWFDKVLNRLAKEVS